MRAIARYLTVAAFLGAFAAPAPSARAGDGAVTLLSGGGSTLLCLPEDAPESAALRAGERRAVLVVHMVAPPPEGDGGLQAELAATGASSRIGLFPGGGFRAADPAEARRYFLPSTEGLTGALCFEIRYEAAPAGKVALSLEASPPLAR